MGWGMARRPKVSSKLGIPNPREGSDGDIQVRQTNLGARLFAKLGGRWFSNILHGNEINSQDVVIPKIWQGSLNAPASEMAHGASPLRLYLPEYINSSNFLTANLGVRWLNVSGQTTLQSWATPSNDPAVECTLIYYPEQNYIGVKEFNIHAFTDSGSIYEYSGDVGFAIDTDSDPDKTAKIIITVFFK